MALPIIFESPFIRWGWGLPVLALLWWLTRNLRQDPGEAPEPQWIGRPLWFPLERLDRDKSRAANALGISLKTLYSRLREYAPRTEA